MPTTDSLQIDKPYRICLDPTGGDNGEGRWQQVSFYGTASSIHFDDQIDPGNQYTLQDILGWIKPTEPKSESYTEASSGDTNVIFTKLGAYYLYNELNNRISGLKMDLDPITWYHCVGDQSPYQIYRDHQYIGITTATGTLDEMIRAILYYDFRESGVKKFAHFTINPKNSTPNIPGFDANACYFVFGYLGDLYAGVVIKIKNANDTFDNCGDMWTFFGETGQNQAHFKRISGSNSNDTSTP